MEKTQDARHKVNNENDKMLATLASLRSVNPPCKGGETPRYHNLPGSNSSQVPELTFTEQVEVSKGNYSILQRYLL